MSDLLLRERPISRRRGVALPAVVASAVLLASFFGVARITSLPASVDRLTIENPHPYHVRVDASGLDGTGWLTVGTVDRDETRTFEQVIDQGDTWMFRFAYAGIDAGSLRVDRRDLVGEGWRIAVPPPVADRLRAAGAVPSG